jgi:cellulose synthase/poly-beta-1,6-N-acetylglucosamine synthase-like glycosyltransferase
MLAAFLIAGLVAAPLSSAALFVPSGRLSGRADGWRQASRRLVYALAGTAVLAALVYEVLHWFGASTRNAVAGAAAVVAVSLLWLPATRRWNARGHLCWTCSVLLFLAYLVFIVQWTLASGLGVFGTIGGLVLWLFEAFAALLALAYLWELCDALGTEDWRRRVTSRTPTPRLDGRPPMVSLHVPAHNEPSDMVIQTLTSLLHLDYPRYEIIAIDDNTEDEALWRPVEAWCAEHGVKFVHLADWPGYKSGALNYALREMTDPQVELVGVVDSDYQIDAGFLGRCAPLFADPQVGFVQAPQDYRDWRHAPYYRRLYYSYKYFFAVSQPSRNERNGAIFAGTMGLIRRRALEETGGWDEWCITEDAELSLRLLRAGWSGLHVDQSWGHGVMPLTFEALKSQRYRWCFGGIQILRMHWRWMLPGAASRDNRLNLAQRWAYLSGAVQWYGDLLGLVFFAFLLAGAVNLATGGDQLFRKLTAFLLAAVPVLVVLGLARAVALLRRGTGARWSDAMGAFFIWQSTSLVVARASVQGLFARRAAFLRTPKTSENMPWWEAFRANWAETLLAALGLAGMAGALTRLDTYSGPLLAALLVFPTLGMAAAPFNSLAARRAALPPDLRLRRSTEWQRDRTMPRGAVAVGGALAIVGGVAAMVALLSAPTTLPVRPPQLRAPLPDHPTSTAPASGTPTPTPSGSTPSPTTVTPLPSTTVPVPTTTPAPTTPAPTTVAPTTPAPTGS